MSQIIFGWPAIFTSIVLSVLGVYWKRPALLVAAGVICIPFTYYVSAGFRTPAAVLPLFHFASAYAVARQNSLLGWVLVAPLVIVAVLLGYAVLTQ